VCSLFPFQHEPFLTSTSLGQGIILNSGVFTSKKYILFSLLLKLCNQIQNQNYYKVKFSEHFIKIFLYVMYYASLLRYWHSVMILVWTDHHCLRVGRHRCYGYNTSRTVIFLKIVVRTHLDVHIRTIVVLTGGKLTGI
jgi:hypothetical protein